MKKLVLSVIVAVFMSGSLLSGTLFAIGDLHVKAGVDGANKFKISEDVKENTYNIVPGYTFDLEYLAIINEIFKVGGGVSYLLPRKLNLADVKGEYSWFPIYATLQVSPFKDSGVYFKGNIGYIVYFEDTSEVSPDATIVEKKGDIYYGFATGYEFKAGILIEMAYDIYTTKKDITYADRTKETIDFRYNKLGFKIGYRFKF